MSDELKYRNEAWLQKQYWENEKSTYEIATECGCSHTTIRRWMESHGIDRRTSAHNPPDDRLTDGEWLRKQYYENEKTVQDIADECGCCHPTVLRWMDHHDIDRRAIGISLSDDRVTDEEWLRKKYWEDEMRLCDIAAECECGTTTVERWMDHHDIDRRAVTRDQSGPNNPNWAGGVFPYGPGWSAAKRRQVRDRDGYECVDCGITQREHKAEYDQKLHVHHLIKARDINDPEERNAPENLITLCCACHKRWERLSEAGIRPQIDGVTADLSEHP